MSNEIDRLTASDLARLYRTRELSPVDVVRRSLERATEVEPKVNAFARIDGDSALVAAKEAEGRFRNIGSVTPLTGVPISVKDNIAVKGMPLRFGSRATDPSPVVADAPVVERLRAAGACIIGKTTMTEFGCKASSDSPLTGVTRNPWNLERSAGGSTSGGAASVAAGVTPITIGTDGAGSLRVPAAFCGIVGLKPQFGRVPVYPASTAPSMLHIGPMARSVADVAMTLVEIAGWDARDPASIFAKYDPALNDDLSGWRIAWSPTLGFGQPNDEILAIVKNALVSFTQAGCVIEEVGSIVDDPRVILPFEFFVGAAYRLKAVLQNDAGLLDTDVAKQLRLTSQFSADDVARAQSMRFAVREKMLNLFRIHRLLITPTVPVEAFNAERASPDDIDALPLNDWSCYTALHNLTGYPAISLPCGTTRAGLPVGVQIIGGPHAEADIISAARRLERDCDFRLPALPN